MLPASPSISALSRRRLLAGLASLPLAGCLGLESRRDASVTFGLRREPLLHVITTRTIAEGGRRSPFLSASRAGKLTYARAHLTPPDPTVMGRLGSIVSGELRVRALEPEGGDAADTFAEALRGRDSLLFVHGYNQTFEAAAGDAVALSDGIGFSGNTALFSWASKGGLLDYGYDRESALIARDPLADALTSVLNDQFGARLHLVAHSMGTLVTLEALRAYRDRNGEKGLDRLASLTLAAPDIDMDVFKANLSRLGTLREKMTVITATNDRALDLSRRLAGGDRVGALPAAAFAGLGVRVVDATEFASGLIRHDAFVANADVRAVIKRAIERS